jgi:hypothetical protein
LNTDRIYEHHEQGYAGSPAADRIDLMPRSAAKTSAPRCFLICLAAAISLALTACTSVGSQRVTGDRFNYNEAIAASGKQQMLTNIVRFRYLDFPVFMAVSSVITSYSFEGGVVAGGTSGLSEALSGDIASVEGNLAYAERPTITYAPLSGQEFTRRMLTPIPVAAIFALGQTGWEIEMLLLTGINRINDVENMSFDIDPAAWNLDDEQQRRELENLRRFTRVVELMVQLARREVLELQRTDGDSRLPSLVFDDRVPEEFQSDVDELKALLGLDAEIDVFRVTTRLTRRKPDEIAIHSRSLLAIMSFLARGGEIPSVHLSDGWVEDFALPNDDDDIPDLPLRIRTQKEPPNNAFAAIKYQGHWFYMDQSDLQSKAVFQMLLALFELKAPAGSGAAPLLTLPAGG